LYLRNVGGKSNSKFLRNDFNFWTNITLRNLTMRHFKSVTFCRSSDPVSVGLSYASHMKPGRDQYFILTSMILKFLSAWLAWLLIFNHGNDVTILLHYPIDTVLDPRHSTWWKIEKIISLLYAFDSFQGDPRSVEAFRDSNLLRDIRSFKGTK